MWLSKFLDVTEDVEELTEEIKKRLFGESKRKKLTPLEFTVLESIFNVKEISGYDLIQNLNRHFAGTWEAKSGTVYPILSKLKKNGFLNSKKVKSPIGPLKKVYYLTEAGEELLKHKVNKNFIDQINFIGNFLVELASIYVHSFPEEKQPEKIKKVQKIIQDMLTKVIEDIPLGVKFKLRCPECGTDLDRSNATYCSVCGASLFEEEAREVSE